MNRFPLPLGNDWKTWGRQLTTTLGGALDNLRWKVDSDRPAQNGTILWDEATNNPVVAVDGKWLPLAYGDNMDQRYDAFGRLRVSDPVTIFDSQLQYDKQPLLWLEKTAGSASSTHLSDESAVDMDVTTSASDSIIRQTREYMRYQPGKSQFILCTGVMGAASTNTNKLIGYGDDENGLFFGQDGDGMYVVQRSSTSGSVVDTIVRQADWNDPMDGTGTSGVTFDPTKANIFAIDLEWLGVGRVRMALNVDGVTYTAHEFLNANANTTTYMTTANLPVRYEITNTGAATANTLKMICSQVTSEGGLDDLQKYPFATYQAGVSIPNGSGNAIMLFAARHAATFNSITNRGMFVPIGYELLATTGTVYSEVIYNPTITSGTWGAISSSSFMEGSIDIGTNFSGGEVIDIGITGSAGRNKVGEVNPKGLSSRLPFGLDIDGANPVALGLRVHALANNVTADIAFHWAEIR